MELIQGDPSPPEFALRTNAVRNWDTVRREPRQLFEQIGGSPRCLPISVDTPDPFTISTDPGFALQFAVRVPSKRAWKRFGDSSPEPRGGNRPEPPSSAHAFGP